MSYNKNAAGAYQGQTGINKNSASAVNNNNSKASVESEKINKDAKKEEEYEQEFEQEQEQKPEFYTEEEYKALEEEFKNSQAEINKLRKNNDEIRENLKSLSVKISDALAKTKPKKQEETMNPEKKENLIKSMNKELKNADNQLKILNKDLSSFKKKTDSDCLTKMGNLENILRSKNREIEDLNNDIKKLKNFRRGNEKQISALEDESSYLKQISVLTEESKALRTKLDALKTREVVDEKSFKNQEEALRNIEQLTVERGNEANMKIDLIKLKEDAEKIVGRVPEDKAANEEENIKKKRPSSPYKLKNIEDIQDEELPKKITEDYFKSKKQIYQKVLKAVKKSEKKRMKTLEGMQAKITELEFENREVLNKIREKEKEVTIAVDKSLEIKKITKHNVLQPLDSSATLIKQVKNLEEFAQKHLTKTILSSRNRHHTKRDAKGGGFSSDVIAFDDIDVCSSVSKYHRIERIHFFVSNNVETPRIIGFQAEYNIKGETVPGLRNISAFWNDYSVETFELDENDTILSFSGFYSDSIDMIKIITKNAESFSVGGFFGRDKSKEFIIDITKYNIPVLLFGGLDYKRSEMKMGELYLAYIGLEMIDTIKSMAKKKRPQSSDISPEKIENEKSKKKRIFRYKLKKPTSEGEDKNEKDAGRDRSTKDDKDDKNKTKGSKKGAGDAAKKDEVKQKDDGKQKGAEKGGKDEKAGKDEKKDKKADDAKKDKKADDPKKGGEKEKSAPPKDEEKKPAKKK